jgi:hypothetical protein
VKERPRNGKRLRALRRGTASCQKLEDQRQFHSCSDNAKCVSPLGISAAAFDFSLEVSGV